MAAKSDDLPEATEDKSFSIRQVDASLLQSTLDTMDQGLLLLDVDQRVALFNRRLLELLDLPYELLARRPLFEEVRQYQMEQGDVPPEPDPDPVMSSVLSAGLAGGAKRHERVRPNGTALEIRTVPLPGGGTVQTFTDITALKRAESEAREAAASLRATLENMDQGLMTVNADGIVQVFNTRAARLLDLPVEFLEKQPYFEEIRRYQLEQNEFAKSNDEFRRWVATSGLRDSWDVYERERPNGTVLEIRTVPLAGGGAVRTYTDITTRKAAERALRESEERLRLAAETTGLGTYDVDITTGQTRWSEEFRALLGLRDGAPESRAAFSAALHPEDRDRVLQHYDRAVAQQATQSTDEFRIARADTGETRWLAGSARFIYDDGRLTRVVGTIRDITVRRTAELALQESEARYRLLADNATDLIERTSMSGVRLYLSPACRDILGYEPEELIGSHLMEMAHPDDGQVIADALAALLTTLDGSNTVTYRLRHKAGHWVHLESHRRLIRDAQDTPVEFLSVSRDVTERLRLEEQLRRAQKMEAMGQLTGGVAHDFNNLLTLVIGNTEILADEVEEPYHRALAGMALEAAERGAHLTQQLLSFARRQSLRVEPLRLDEVVDSMLALLKRTLGEQIEVRTRAEARHSRVLADRGLLESALLNLALNARDAMPSGGALTLSTGERLATPADGDIPPGQPIAYVTVSDTGTGIAPEVLAHVFEPFFTTKEVGKGSGLGLAMVYGFAEQSGGHVSIESTAGEGTSVTIVLPVMSGKLDRQDEGSGVKETAAPPAKKRVLVVEDEPQVLQFVTAQLLNLDYEVTAVSTARDALSLLDQGVFFDLLFTDIVLPQGMSGVELARRAALICPDLKVLLTSGYPQEVFEQHGRPPENTPLLRKPYRRKDLLEALARTFSGTKA